MAQEYTVSSWQPWETDDGPVRDNFGNYKGSVWFEEDTRQLDATFKTEPQVGDKKYGDIVEYKTKAGKTRLKFQRADRPDDGQQQALGNNGPSGTPKREWQPREDHHEEIKAQWAIGQAVQLEIAAKKTGELDLDAIQAYATDFYIMVDRVKGSSESTDPKLPTTLNTPKNSGASGYEKFKASRPKTDDEIDAESESLYAAIATQEYEEVEP